MKSLFLFFTIVISINSIAQSKKEQIDILNVRVDSLNSAYVKATKLLSNAVQKVNKENVDLSEQLEKSKEQLKKKSATITDKSATIKSLNARNMDLMNEIKDLRTGQKNLMAQQKTLKFSLDSIDHLNAISNEDVIIPPDAVPFHGIFQGENQYDGTWTYALNFDKGHLMGVSTLYLKSGFEDKFEINCNCPAYESIPEGSRVFGFAVKSKCSFEDVSDGSVRLKECYRPIILRKY
jgi:hypothetical protein